MNSEHFNNDKNAFLQCWLDETLKIYFFFITKTQFNELDLRRALEMYEIFEIKLFFNSIFKF